MDHNDTIDGLAPVAGPTTTTTDESVGGAGARHVLPAFLAELARAMQAAAERERERIAEFVADEAAENVEKTRTRAAAETEELRRMAEEDVERIQDWSATEIKRIRHEAQRRTDERRNDLEAYVAQHDSIIATEIDGLDAAVRDYRATLDQFFNELTGSTDPADIARRAGSLPTPPDLDDVRAAARAAAVEALANAPEDDVRADPGPSADAADDDDEPSAEAWAGLGVMDSDAVGRSQEVPDVLREVDAEAATESAAAAPPADALHVPADEAAEADVAEPVDHSSAAVRLLRSIAPWTTPAEHDTQDHGSQTR
jgi:hypothetical protein